MRRLLSLHFGSRLLGALAAGAALSACSDGSAERDGTDASFTTSVVAAPGEAATLQSSSLSVVSRPARSGGQSGGEGDGLSGDSFSSGDEAPPQPCACMSAASAGVVLSMTEGCARVAVTAVYDSRAAFEVGDELSGEFHLACPLSQPAHAGDAVLFQYSPDPAGGHFSALVVHGETVSFHFAGREREASIAELTVPRCWNDQFAILNEPGATAAWARDQQLDSSEPSHDPVQCFQSDQQ
jgi:hypothetical protein